MDLLHPNLLTNEQIVALLKERQLNIPNITEMGREELVRLYRSFILPQPCRRTRNSGSPENGSGSSTEKECPEKMNGELKRKHNRITFSEEGSKPKETHHKIKRADSKSESTTATKRKPSPERSPPQNPHSKRKKITWP